MPGCHAAASARVDCVFLFSVYCFGWHRQSPASCQCSSGDAHWVHGSSCQPPFPLWAIILIAAGVALIFSIVGFVAIRSCCKHGCCYCPRDSEPQPEETAAPTADKLPAASAAATAVEMHRAPPVDPEYGPSSTTHPVPASSVSNNEPLPVLVNGVRFYTYPNGPVSAASVTSV